MEELEAEGINLSYHNGFETLKAVDVMSRSSYPTTATLINVMAVIQITPKTKTVGVKYWRVTGRVTGYSKRENMIRTWRIHGRDVYAQK